MVGIRLTTIKKKSLFSILIANLLKHVIMHLELMKESVDKLNDKPTIRMIDVFSVVRMA